MDAPSAYDTPRAKVRPSASRLFLLWSLSSLAPRSRIRWGIPRVWHFGTWGLRLWRCCQGGSRRLGESNDSTQRRSESRILPDAVAYLSLPMFAHGIYVFIA